MRAVVIVQARMTSKRLPGKVLLPLGGISILEHVLTRCQGIVNADMVCCAVPEATESDPIIREAERLEVEIFKGSETDVLDRYYQAARAYEAEFILRVTSDCPMLDPKVCADVLALVREGSADFACNNMPPTWPHGLDCEAVTFEWLQRAAKKARLPLEREHVMPWIRCHPDISKANLTGPGNGAEMHRWTIDNEQDYVFLTGIWEKLPKGAKAWDYRVPLEIANAHPELAGLNMVQNPRKQFLRFRNNKNA